MPYPRLVSFVTALTLLLSLVARADDKDPIPPKNAAWTIAVQVIGGTDHVAQANLLKKELRRTSNMNDWYVIHGEDDSRLFYGYYPSINDAAHRDREKIDALKDAAGNQPFHGVIVPIDQPDPSGPPEWNLARKNLGKTPDDPNFAYYTLQVGVYMNSPDRKKAAVDAVAEARKHGIEAYYYHGPDASSVCIGAWPRSAVKQQSAPPVVAPNQPIIVSNTPLSPQTEEVLKKDNPDAKVITPDFQPLDPTLIQAMKDYPASAVNGEYIKRNGKFDPSVLVRVPEADSALAAPTPQDVPPVAPPTLLTPTPPTPGQGKLRSLSDN